MIEFIVPLVLSFVLTLVAMLVGYSLGKNQTVVPPDMKKQINQIFRKVVPPDDIGPIERPNAKQNYYRDNPDEADLDDMMTKTFDTLNK